MLNVPGVPLGSAALHPRLYSNARIRGLRYDIHALCKNVGNNWRGTAVGLLDVYRGHQTWADFIGGQALFTALEELSPRRTRDALTDDKSETLSIGLTARDHQVAVES